VDQSRVCEPPALRAEPVAGDQCVAERGLVAGGAAVGLPEHPHSVDDSCGCRRDLGSILASCTRLRLGRGATGCLDTGAAALVLRSWLVLGPIGHLSQVVDEVAQPHDLMVLAVPTVGGGVARPVQRPAGEAVSEGAIAA